MQVINGGVIQVHFAHFSDFWANSSPISSSKVPNLHLFSATETNTNCSMVKISNKASIDFVLFAFFLPS